MSLPDVPVYYPSAEMEKKVLSLFTLDREWMLHKVLF